MDSETARNIAIWEVANNLGASDTNNVSAEIREKYETERTNQEALKATAK